MTNFLGTMLFVLLLWAGIAMTAIGIYIPAAHRLRGENDPPFLFLIGKVFWSALIAFSGLFLAAFAYYELRKGS